MEVGDLLLFKWPIRINVSRLSRNSMVLLLKVVLLCSIWLFRRRISWLKNWMIKIMPRVSWFNKNSKKWKMRTHKTNWKKNNKMNKECNKKMKEANNNKPTNPNKARPKNNNKTLSRKLENNKKTTLIKYSFEIYQFQSLKMISINIFPGMAKSSLFGLSKIRKQMFLRELLSLSSMIHRLLKNLSSTVEAMRCFCWKNIIILSLIRWWG